MKNIRLQYKLDAGIRIQPEINLVQDYTKENAYGRDIHVFPNLYDYILWLEDQLNKTSAELRIEYKELSDKLMRL